jgi:hypothetical protein
VCPKFELRPSQIRNGQLCGLSIDLRRLTASSSPILVYTLRSNPRNLIMLPHMHLVAILNMFVEPIAEDGSAGHRRTVSKRGLSAPALCAASSDDRKPLAPPPLFPRALAARSAAPFEKAVVESDVVSLDQLLVRLGIAKTQVIFHIHIDPVRPTP